MRDKVHHRSRLSGVFPGRGRDRSSELMHKIRELEKEKTRTAGSRKRVESGSESGQLVTTTVVRLATVMVKDVKLARQIKREHTGIRCV